MRYEGKKNQLLMVILAVGFFIGIIYENVLSGKNGLSMQIFQKEQLELFRNMKIEQREYLVYILKLRILPLISILALWNFRWRRPVLILGLGWIGLWFGRMVVSAVISQGITGMLICVAGMFPHMLFYGVMFAVLVFHLYDDHLRRWNKAKTAGVVAMFLLGVLTEVYINPTILKIILGFV